MRRRWKGSTRDKTVIFVMNHRSNMDYVLVTWLAAERSHLSYAVGEWARVWPLPPLIRMRWAPISSAAVSNNPLYRKVLARYVQISTEAGHDPGDVPRRRAEPDRRAARPQDGAAVNTW
jgi:glycerol-3-phosphate O-acyltransferase